ncbi:MAG: metallophosphoesterase [Actinomycetia bacterium]|nr:metallophosphoesterase [Actinomycetes bacterium]
MANPIWPPPTVRPWAAVFAVEPDRAQVIWRDRPGRELRILGGDTDMIVPTDHGAGAIDVVGLVPGADTVIEVHTASGRIDLALTTLTPPPGEEVMRVATMNDMHIGCNGFGVLRTMRHSDPDPHTVPERATMAALAESAAWGGAHLLIKGDAVHQSHQHTWDALARLLEADGRPVDLIPGNHEVSPSSTVDVPDLVAGHPLHREPHRRDLPGLSIVLLDTTIAGRGRGRLDHAHEEAISLAADAPGPVMLATHHHLQTTERARHIPVGVARSQADRFLDDLHDVRPGSFLTHGHTHRCRTRTYRSLRLTEISSTVDHPGVWAGYAIHEGGIRQVVRRITDPAALTWSDYARWAVGGYWGRYASGRLEDRCLVHSFDPAAV